MSIPSITRQWLKISTVKLHSVERADTMARMGLKILAINPGSTSTKLAIYEDTTECWKKGVGHSSQDIARSRRMQDQLELRSDGGPRRASPRLESSFRMSLPWLAAEGC